MTHPQETDRDRLLKLCDAVLADHVMAKMPATGDVARALRSRLLAEQGHAEASAGETRMGEYGLLLNQLTTARDDDGMKALLWDYHSIVHGALFVADRAIRAIPPLEPKPEASHIPTHAALTGHRAHERHYPILDPNRRGIE
jgi:hypothetical protein